MWPHGAILLALFHLVYSQKDGPPSCGLPANLADLPDFAQEEIKDIWRNYVAGTSCERELAVQKDVFDVVQNFDTQFSEKVGSINTSDAKSESESSSSSFSSSSSSFSSSSSSSSPPVATTTPKPLDYDQIPVSFTSSSQISAQTQVPIFGSGQELRQTASDVDDYLDQTTFDDVAMLQFDTVNAPFLRSATEDVKSEFQKIWHNRDIPSENLRALKIQTLAVSLLSGKQLSEYSRWATKRKRVLKAREEEMRHLSSDAKRTLRKISSPKARDEGEKIVVSPSVRQELTSFVQRLNRRRSLKLVH